MSYQNSDFVTNSYLCKNMPDEDLELISQSQSCPADPDFIPTNSADASSESSSGSHQVRTDRKMFSLSNAPLDPPLYALSLNLKDSHVFSGSFLYIKMIEKN